MYLNFIVGYYIFVVIGVPKEVKSHEYRVAVTPDGVRKLVRDGHRVLVGRSAGEGSGFPDSEYIEAGAGLVESEAVFGDSELVVKVKEPVSSEYAMLKQGQALFTFLHLASAPELTAALLKKGITALGYETLHADGALPLLTPMSEVAGRMGPIMASYYLKKTGGGSGILPTGVPGAPPANILIIGAGVVGTNAARVAVGLGMNVTVLNRGVERLRALDELFMGRIRTLTATEQNIRACLKDADIVIGAVLLPGAKAPVCVTEEMVKTMKKGSVIVDVSIDQGGSIGTSRPTTHDDPVYEVHGVIHYAVTNMPGAYPRTSTIALTAVSLPYIRKLASMGIEKAIREDIALRSALNTYKGMVLHKGLAESMGLPLGEI